MKKTLIRAAFVLLAAAIVTAPAAAFSPSNWAAAEIARALEWGLLDEWDFNTKQFTKKITKEEFCKVAVAMADKIGAERTGGTGRRGSQPGWGGTQPGRGRTRFYEGEVPDYVSTAYQYGIISGTGEVRDGRPVLGLYEELSRQQVALMLYQALSFRRPGEKIASAGIEPTLAAFSDNGEIAYWAREAAAYMAGAGFIAGDGERFMPTADCTFEEAVCIARRVCGGFADVQTLSRPGGTGSLAPAPVITSPGNGVTLYVQKGVRLEWGKVEGASSYIIRIEGASGGMRTGYTEDTSYTLPERWLAEGTLSVSVAAAGQTGSPLTSPAFLTLNLVNHRDYHFDFKSAAEAASYMKTVTVNVWKLDSAGQKYAATMRVTVHRFFADDVVAIFNEIFNGSEKFPIYYLGGYNYGSGTSEHSKGTAVDINPNENYYLSTGGTKQVGSFWKPGENVYSILPGGDVVKAFEKYGWFWGGNGWSTGVDYMHFSRFGR